MTSKGEDSISRGSNAGKVSKGNPWMSTHSRPNSQQPRLEREGGSFREAMAGGSVTDTLSDVFDVWKVM